MITSGRCVTAKSLGKLLILTGGAILGFGVVVLKPFPYDWRNWLSLWIFDGVIWLSALFIFFGAFLKVTIYLSNCKPVIASPRLIILAGIVAVCCYWGINEFYFLNKWEMMFVGLTAWLFFMICCVFMIKFFENKKYRFQVNTNENH